MKKELLVCIVLGLLLFGSINIIYPKNEWIAYPSGVPVCIAEGAPHYFMYYPVIQRTNDINNMTIWVGEP